MTLVAGTTIGPYRIIEQIGRGGMATVYKAYQASLARNVAIKVLPAFFAEDPGFRERFQQEAIAVAKLRHPSILQVFGGRRREADRRGQSEHLRHRLAGHRRRHRDRHAAYEYAGS